MKIAKILAPTDLSDLSIDGLRYALDTAESYGAEVIVYHVIGPSEEWIARQDQALTMETIVANRRSVLARFVKIAAGDSPREIPVRSEVEVGTPHRKIVERAAAEKADLIIMSTHGWSGLLHLLIGSVTEKVVNQASCPVLSLHPFEEDRAAARSPS